MLFQFFVTFFFFLNKSCNYMLCESHMFLSSRLSQNSEVVPGTRIRLKALEANAKQGRIWDNKWTTAYTICSEKHMMNNMIYNYTNID